jgi:hypothetical protein
MRRTAGLFVGFFLLSGCSSDPNTKPAVADGRPLQSAIQASQEGELPPAMRRDLATLRAATSRFHRFAEARRANYTFLFMNMCMVDQSPNKLGGMGLHYVNTDSLDGHVNVSAPEALLYEPDEDGRLQLVAVEYVIPKDAWHDTKPPRLFGRELKLNEFGLYALHAWVWKHNPSGLFASWNPRVNCDNAGAGSRT